MVSEKNRLLLIQTFRGIAALVILLHHGTGLAVVYNDYRFLNSIFLAGWSGVDFFFVLSGFIIFYVHYKDVGKQEKLKSFLYKRFVRVYPVYWMVTLILVPVFFLFPSWGNGYERDFLVIIKSLMLLPQENPPIVGVGWSLVYEVFFYLMFSFVIILKQNWSKVIVSLWILAIMLNFLEILNVENNFFLSFVLNNYNVQFLLGCLSAYLVMKVNLSKYALIILFSGVIMFIALWYGVLIGTLERYESITILSYGIASALIIFGGAKIDIQGKVRVPKFFLLAGDASYSIYLIHFYVIVFLLKLAKRYSISVWGEFITISLVLIATFLISCLFHLVIEKPLLKFSQNKKWKGGNIGNLQKYIN